MKGSGGAFFPNSDIKRAHLVLMITRGARAAGKPLPLYTGNTKVFADVPVSHPYYKEIMTAYTAGILSGSTGTDGRLYFRPDSPASRNHVAKMTADWSSFSKNSRARRGAKGGYRPAPVTAHRLSWLQVWLYSAVHTHPWGGRDQTPWATPTLTPRPVGPSRGSCRCRRGPWSPTEPATPLRPGTCSPTSWWGSASAVASNAWWRLPAVAKKAPSRLSTVRISTPSTATCSSDLGSPSAAEDVTSQVFLGMVRGLGRYRDEGKPFVAWLYGIAQKQIAFFLRGQSRSPGAVDLDAAAELVAHRRRSSRHRRAAGVRVAIARALNKVPDGQREVIMLRYILSLSVAETAAVVDRTEGAVKQLQLRGLATLKSDSRPGRA